MDHKDFTAQKYMLDNGLNVVVQPSPSRTVYGCLRIHHGSAHEQAGEDGIAHFLEHILVTGGSAEFSPEEAQEVRTQLGYFNAATGIDTTSFYGDMLSADLDTFLRFTAATVFSPRFSPEKMEEERQRVLREIADEKSKPNFNDHRRYNRAFFGEDSLYARHTLGKEEIIASAPLEKFRAFHQRGYHPNNANLVLAGGLLEGVVEQLTAIFGKIPAGDYHKYEFPPAGHLESKRIIHTFAPDLYNHDTPEQSSAEFGLSFMAVPYNHPDVFAVILLKKILGEGSASRLFRRLSEKMGIAYGVGIDYTGFRNQGYVALGGKISAAKAEEGIAAVFEEMQTLKSELIDEKVVERLKRHTEYTIAKDAETNSGRVNMLHFSMDYGISLEDYLRGIARVTNRQIQEAAQKYFPSDRENGKYALLLRDPLKDDPK